MSLVRSIFLSFCIFHLSSLAFAADDDLFPFIFIGKLDPKYHSIASLVLKYSRSQDNRLSRLVSDIPRNGYIASQCDQAVDSEKICIRVNEQEDIVRHFESIESGHFDFIFLQSVGEDKKIIREFRYLEHNKPTIERRGYNAHADFSQPNTKCGHTSLIDEDEEIKIDEWIQILFAGQIKIQNFKIVKWDANSGHFRPSERSADVVSLPREFFSSAIAEAFEEALLELAESVHDDLLNTSDNLIADLLATETIQTIQESSSGNFFDLIREIALRVNQIKKENEEASPVEEEIRTYKQEFDRLREIDRRSVLETIETGMLRPSSLTSAAIAFLVMYYEILPKQLI